MKTLIDCFRQHMPMLIGAVLLILMVDGFILVYRLIGLSRTAAVYAALFTCVLLGSLLARRIFNPCSSIQLEEETHA